MEITPKISSEESALSKINLPSNIKKSSLAKWAKEKGFKQIGKGAYGSVFYSISHPDIVIKVFSDKSYNFWYKIAKANQDNPYVLKFKGKPVKIAPDLWAVRIEKLAHLDTSRFDEICSIKSWLLYTAQESYGIPLYSKISSTRRMDEIKKNYIEYDLEVILTEILWNLSKGQNYLKYKLDFNTNNIMLRGNQLVITDPLAPLLPRDRKELNLLKPSTNEDASFNDKYKSIDIFNMFPKKQEEAFDNSRSERRKELISDRKLKRILIGSKDGPEFSAYYCENTRMFLPSFNIRE